MGISSLVWLCGTSRASPAKLLGPAVEPAGLLGLIAGSSQAPAAPPLCDSWGPAACTYLGECLRGSELFGKHQGAQGQGVPTRLHKPPKEVEHGLLLLLCCVCVHAVAALSQLGPWHHMLPCTPEVWQGP